MSGDILEEVSTTIAPKKSEDKTAVYRFRRLLVQSQSRASKKKAEAKK